MFFKYKKNILASIGLLFLLAPQLSSAVTNYFVTVSGDASASTGGTQDSGNTDGFHGDLRYVITKLNANGSGPLIGNNVIQYGSSIPSMSLTADLPVIQNGVTIQSTLISAGTQQQISGASTWRIFATYKASLVLTNLLLVNGAAIGGSSSDNGGSGGGGGLGAGGGAYIDIGQSLTLNNTSIVNCNATGGAGGGASNGGFSAGGGGGASFTGLNGFTQTKNNAGATGGGDHAGDGSTNGGTSAYTSLPNGYGGGAGGGADSGKSSGSATTGNGAGSAASGHNGGNGGYCGGGGGAATEGNGSGGGGNGGGAGASGSGGGGGYGSGGGVGIGGGEGSGGGGGGFGGGGAGSSGGSHKDASGGGGGFGAGGGGGADNDGGGAGGSYGGAGGHVANSAAGGGGGAGIGGALFIGDSSTLTIGDYSVNGNSMLPSGYSTPGNTAVGGASGGFNSAVGRPNTADQTAGLFKDIFLFQTASVTFNGSNSLTVPYSIQGDTATSTNKDHGVTISVGSSAVVSFTATSNTYQGGTNITSGALSAGGANLPTTGTVAIGSSGALLTTGATAITVPVTNQGKLNLGGPSPSSLTNSNGAIYVVTGGSIPNAISAGGGTASLTIGQNYLGVNDSGTNCSLTAAITNMPTVAVYAGLFSNSGSGTIGGVTSSFHVYGGTATIGAQVTGGGSATNDSNLIFAVNNAVATTGAFSNTSNFYSAFQFTPTSYSSFANTGAVYIYGGSGSISGAFSPSASGGSLNFGQDINNTPYNNTNTTGAISNTPTINVYAGTFSPGGNITGVDSGFSVVNSGATATLAVTMSGLGTVANSGTLNHNVTDALANMQGLFTNSNTVNLNQSLTRAYNTTNNGGVSGGIAIASGKTFSNGATFTQTSGPISGAGAYTNTATFIYNSASANDLAFTGLFTNSNTVQINQSVTRSSATTNNGGASGGIAIASGKTFTHSNTFTQTSGPISGAGAFTNSGTFIYNNSTAATDLAITGLFTNSNMLNVTQSMSRAGPTANTGTIAIPTGMQFTNSGTFTPDSGTIGGPGTFVNAGTFNVTVATTNNCALFSNTSNISISSNLNGTGTVTNTGSLTLAGGANVSNAIVNSTGNMFITGNAAATTISSAGNVTVTGQNTLTATSYTNSGTHKTSITSGVVFDKLICSGCAVDLTGATVAVTTGFNGMGIVGNLYTWDVITGTSVVAPANVSLPNSSLFNTWSYATPVTNKLTIEYIRSKYDQLAIGPINIALAFVLEEIANGPTTPQITAILNAISSATTVAQFNEDLNKLLPNRNGTAPKMATQSAIFGRIERRIAALRSEILSPSGFTAGDFNPNTALWFATFGSLSKQRDTLSNPGYRGRTGGILVGADHRTCDEDFIGAAIGMSNSNVLENSNNDFTTKIMSYHAILYSANHLRNNYFVDWLFTGSMSKNNGHRFSNISGTDFNVYSSYKGHQAGFKVNYGKNFDFGDYLRLSPLTSLHYSLLHQPAYTETGAATGLHVETQKLKSILTLGAGSKISLPTNAWWLAGSRELRAMVTYDVVNAADITQANFIAGGSSFTLINTPARWALRLGVDFGVELVSSLQLQFSYDYELRSKYTDHTGMIKLKFLL